jgi:hypothetical protein
MESFWSGENLKRIVRQSAIAADVIAVDTANALSPALKTILPPITHSEARHKAASASACDCQPTQPFVAFKPLTPC